MKTGKFDVKFEKCHLVGHFLVLFSPNKQQFEPQVDPPTTHPISKMLTTELSNHFTLAGAGRISYTSFLS